jgi:hypothetical protein
VPDAASVTIQERLAAEADDLVFLEDQAHERAFANYPYVYQYWEDGWYDDPYWDGKDW